jgi:hypothetical protein
MAIVQGIKEKVHLPIYDSLSVGGAKQLRDVETTSILKFFVNVQGKTKLETNLQSASLLPHYNTFEARAMRVVISDLPPKFPEKSDKLTLTKTDLPVLSDGDPSIEIHLDTVAGVNRGKVLLTANPPQVPTTGGAVVKADIQLGLDRIMELLYAARRSDDGVARIRAEEPGVTLKAQGFNAADIKVRDVFTWGSIEIEQSDLEDLIDAEIKDEKQRPPKEQLSPNNGAGTIIGKLIYNTVTTLYVGEKIMIQMPTWFFPSGAGPYSETARFTTHGKPSPLATFRFAEPIFIDKQQNFRVELEIPDTDTLKEIQKIYGPFNIWVVLDGYMTRDVQ